MDVKIVKIELNSKDKLTLAKTKRKVDQILLDIDANAKNRNVLKTTVNVSILEFPVVNHVDALDVKIVNFTTINLKK